MSQLLMIIVPFHTCALIILLYLAFIYIYRIQNGTITGGIGDALAQYTTAIKAIWQDSICPKLQSYGKIQGYCSYPVAFAWYCGQAGKIRLFQNIFQRKITKNTLFQSLEAKKTTELQTSLIILKLLSAVIFPLVSQLIVFICCLFIGNFTLVSLLTGLGAAMSMDSIFTEQKYAISTRNIGYFLYFIFASQVLVFAYFNASQDGIDVLQRMLLWLTLFITSLLLHQCSQRSSQTFIVLLITLSILVLNYQIHFLAIYLVAQFILLQTPFCNYSEFVRSHLYNRIHDSEWSSRTYGNFRYGFIQKLNKHLLKTFRGDLFRLDYLNTHMVDHPYYKYNWFALFAVHRIYIYLGLIIFLNGDISSAFLVPIEIVLISSVIPSVLCFFKPFQGYGASEVYLWSNIPLGYLSSLPFIIDSISNPSNYSNASFLISFTIIFETFYILCKGLWFRYKKIKMKGLSFIYSIKQSDLLDGSPTSFVSSENLQKVHNFMEELVSNRSSFKPIRPTLSIMAYEMHPQPYIEVLVKYINELAASTVKLKPAFVELDNISYGYSHDYVGFQVMLSKISEEIKPDIIFLDISRPQSKVFLNSLIKFKKPNANIILFRSGTFILINCSQNIYFRKK